MGKRRLLQHTRRQGGHGFLADLLDESLAHSEADGSASSDAASDPAGLRPNEDSEKNACKASREDLSKPNQKTKREFKQPFYVVGSVIMRNAPDPGNVGRPGASDASGGRRHKRAVESAVDAAVVLRSAPKLLCIVRFLLEQQIQNGGHATPWLTKRDVANGVEDPPKNMAAALWDALNYQLVVRLEIKHGRTGGTVYHIPEELHAVILRLSSRPAARSQEPATDRRRPEQRLVALADQLGLDDWTIGVNDLLSVWRFKGADGNRVFASLDDLIESVDRIAFYLRSPQAKGIKDPRRWALSQFRQGVYGRPAGYRSWRERQHEDLLRTQAEEAASIERLREEQFEAKFRLWKSQLPQSQILKLVAGLDPDGVPAAALLRDAFRQETHARLKSEELATGS